MDKRKEFLEIYEKAKKKYGKAEKRLAGESWGASWKTLVATILSAQSRDDTTIQIAEALFKKYPTLEKLANAKHTDVLRVLRSMNYNKTKTKHVIGAAKFIRKEWRGIIPDKIEELTRIPGVGRKTANLVIWEEHRVNVGICVDTHVHRISNVLGLVKTKNPEKTEFALMEIVPKRYWGSVNRLFVLWGKECSGWDRKKLLAHL